MKPKDNPLATKFILRLDYYMSKQDWDLILGSLKSLSYRASVIGPNGSGKTTFLESLYSKLVANGFKVQYFTTENEPLRIVKILQVLSKTDVVIIDGFQSLTYWQRALMLTILPKVNKGLVFSAHKSFNYPVLMETKGEFKILDQILRELISYDLISKFDLITVAKQFFNEEQANIRSVLLRMYDYLSEIDCELARKKLSNGINSFSN